MNNTAENIRNDSLHLAELSAKYTSLADDLDERRRLLAERRKKPALPIDELRSLDLRIAALSSESHDLRSIALALRRKSAPLPPSPSLARRERALS